MMPPPARGPGRPTLMLSGYRHRGGVYSPTTALAHLFAFHGLRAEESGEPFDESDLLGLAGGVGFRVGVYRGAWGVHLSLGFEAVGGGGLSTRRVCEGLGVAVLLEETGNGALAAKSLDRLLTAGRPAILWGSAASLPESGLRPELAPLVEAQWIAFGLDEETGEVWAGDARRRPFRLSRRALADARAGYFPAKNRMLALAAEGEPEPVPVVASIPRALTAHREALAEPLLPSQGLAGLERWAADLVAREGPGAWRDLFPAGLPLFDVLVEIFRAIELDTGGGALRPLQAEFLDRAAEILGRPELIEAANATREAAEAWTALASAALPREAPSLARARDLLQSRHRIGREASASESRLVDLDREFQELRRWAGEDFPLTPGEVSALLADLSRRVEWIRRLEARIAQLLESET